MAYARYGNDSDVYVYADTRGGFTCERCPKISKEFRCSTGVAMAEHLVGFHRARGDRVPDKALKELRTV